MDIVNVAMSFERTCTTPMQLGPRTRMPDASRSASIFSCSATPSAPVSAKPDVMTAARLDAAFRALGEGGQNVFPRGADERELGRFGQGGDVGVAF